MKKPKRKHGLSRREKLLQASIRQELQIKALRRDLCALSLDFANYKLLNDLQWERLGKAGTLYDIDRGKTFISDSSEVSQCGI